MPPASFRQTAGLGHVGVLRLFSGATGLLSYCCSSWRINGSGRRNVPKKKKKKKKHRHWILIKVIRCSEYFHLLSGVTATRSALNAEESELWNWELAVHLHVRPPRRAPATESNSHRAEPPPAVSGWTWPWTWFLCWQNLKQNSTRMVFFFVLHQHSAAADKESSERPNIRSNNKSVFSSSCLLFKSLEHKYLISYCWWSLMMVIRLINNETGVSAASRRL